MQIILDEKIYVASAPKGRMVRRAFEIIENINLTCMKTADLDNLVGFIVELFGQQFTIDDVYDGLPAADLMPTLMGCVNLVVGKVGEKLEQFPNGQTEA
jgi:hypothetical protein